MKEPLRMLMYLGLVESEILNVSYLGPAFHQIYNRVGVTHNNAVISHPAPIELADKFKINWT
jgi:hypothetical protein